MTTGNTDSIARLIARELRSGNRLKGRECQKCRGSGWMNIGGGEQCDACGGCGRIISEGAA